MGDSFGPIIIWSYRGDPWPLCLIVYFLQLFHGTRSVPLAPCTMQANIKELLIKRMTFFEIRFYDYIWHNRSLLYLHAFASIPHSQSAFVCVLKPLFVSSHLCLCPHLFVSSRICLCPHAFVCVLTPLFVSSQTIHQYVFSQYTQSIIFVILTFQKTNCKFNIL